MVVDVKRDLLRRALEWHVDLWCRRPMEWGIDDCALATANVIRSALGYDPAAPWRTGYRDQEGAVKELGRLGLGFALRSAAKAHGWKRIDLDLADVGDVGLMMIGHVPVTVMCKAPGWFIGRGSTGATLLRARNDASPNMSVRICWQL